MAEPSVVGRREWLQSLGGAAAGIAWVQQAVAQEQVPGNQVVDRASSLRITGLKTYWVGPIVYVKIETNQGIFGWGDLKGTDVRVGKVLVESLFELLEGENPTRPLFQKTRHGPSIGFGQLFQLAKTRLSSPVLELREGGNPNPRSLTHRFQRQLEREARALQSFRQFHSHDLTAPT